MSQSEWKRFEAVERVSRGELTVPEAARVVGLSKRQMRRLCRRVEARGAAGAIHGNHGRWPSNRTSEEVRARVVELMRSKYAGFNDRHFVEKLGEVEALNVGRETVRRILRLAGIGAARKRRAPRHRRRRERMAREGMMLLWDGSRHQWLEERGPWLCLMGAIDDATGELMPGAHFVEQECSAGYLKVLLATCREKGLAWSIYMDRHSSLHRNHGDWTLEEELAGEQTPTQVGRALKELGIEPIYALSPQAKGRVERLWGTLQDRLVSELRLRQVSALEEANVVLEEFRLDFNRRFRKAPADRKCAWRKAKGLDVPRICSFRYEATVLNDNTVRRAGLVMDIPPGPSRRSYAGARVELRHGLDGKMRIYQGEVLIAQTQATAAMPKTLHPGHRRRVAASSGFGRPKHKLSLLEVITKYRQPKSQLVSLPPSPPPTAQVQRP